MKKFYATALFVTAILFAANAQERVFADYENDDSNGAYSWGKGQIDVVNNPVKDAVNSSEKVLKKVYAGTNKWAAVAYWDATGKIVDSGNKMIEFDIFIPDGNKDISKIGVYVKFQNSISDADNYTSDEKQLSATGKWHHLAYNITDLEIYDYCQLGIQVDDNDFGVFYLDNIVFRNSLIPTSTSNIDAASRLTISSSTGKTTFHNVANSEIRVYNIGGQQIISTYAVKNKLTVSLMPGIYIVTDGKESVKFIVK